MNRASIAAIALGIALIGTATLQAPASAGKPSNLQVYPANTPKKALKKDMKVISKALGVRCDFCHDMKSMAKDTDHKKVARKMMRMTRRLNKRDLKDYGKVTCKTCHQGKAEPASLK